MIIRIAKNSGFCFGVKRAIQIAQNASVNNSNVVTLGPIIHNPQMVEKLKKNGVGCIENISEISDQTIIIRSHGVPQDVFKHLQEKEIDVIDATCPYVSMTQQYAKELMENDYQVVILGNKRHPEVIALHSYVNENSIIVNNTDEMPNKKFKKLGIISQTTQPVEKLQQLVYKVIPNCQEIRVINTICDATSIRQQSTLELAKDSDIMIVIGGRNSANTKMLAIICKNIVETYHIEIASELKKDWFKNKKKIGITAGASTPDWSITKIYNKITYYLGINHLKINNVEEIPGYKENA